MSTDQSIAQPQEGLKMPTASDVSPQACLARAIVNKDVESAKLYASQINLRGDYLSSSWSSRLVENFDPDVATVLDAAGLRPNFPKRLLRSALAQDAPQAYHWVLNHPQCKDFFSGAYRNLSGWHHFVNKSPWHSNGKFVLLPTERDIAITTPFLVYCCAATKVSLSLFKQENFGQYIDIVSNRFLPLFKDLVEGGEWGEIDALATVVSSIMGHQSARSLLLPILRDVATNTKSSRILELENAMKDYPSQSLFTQDPIYKVYLPTQLPRWFKHTDQKSAEPLFAGSLSEVALLSASPLLPKMLENEAFKQIYLDAILDKHTGSTVLAILSSNNTGPLVGKVISELGPALDGWRDSQGHNPAHVLMAVKPSVVLAEFFLRYKPEWIMEKVGQTPIPLEMIGAGSINESRLTAQARIRRKALNLHVAKSPVRSSKNNGIRM